MFRRLVYLVLLFCTKVVWGQPEGAFIHVQWNQPGVWKIRASATDKTPPGPWRLATPQNRPRSRERQDGVPCQDGYIALQPGDCSSDDLLDLEVTASALPWIHQGKLEKQNWRLSGPFQPSDQQKVHPAAVFASTLAALISFAFLLFRRNAKHQSALRRLETLERMKLSGEPEAGAQIADYLVLSVLGRGGMGTVYQVVRADHEGTAESFALKAIPSQSGVVEEFRERFRRECQVLSTLRHPSIVQVYDYGETDDHFYLVMELIEGEPLENRIRQGGSTLEELTPVLLAVMEALSFAHEQGVVHRDIKPANIMITTTGRVKVLDFGLARKRDLPKVSATGRILGTPSYMPPEQMRGLSGLIEPASDQYSLGIMMFELLTGRLPFEGEDTLDIVQQHVYHTPPALSRFRPDLGKELEAFLNRLLAKRPEARFASMETARLAFLEALKSAGSKGQATSPSLASKEPPTKYFSLPED